MRGFWSKPCCACWGLLVSSFALSQPDPGTFNLNVENVSALPKELREASGLAIWKKQIWTHNDGRVPELFAFDLDSKKLVKTVTLSGATNFDWEDLAQDDEFLYVADIGNNQLKERSVFTLYKVSWKNLEASKNKGKVSAEKIYFEYGDADKRVRTDAEALAVVGGELWLFTKNWSDGTSHFYKIDPKKKKQVLSKIGTYPVKGLITAADYNPHTSRLILLGYDRDLVMGDSFVWTVDVRDRSLDWNLARRQVIKPHAQWEAVLWMSDKRAHIFSESSLLGAAAWAELNFSAPSKAEGSKQL